MSPILEGNEVETEYAGGAGKLIIDVTAKGEALISNVLKKDIDGIAEVESVTTVKTSVFKLLKKVTDKTATKWDDNALAALMKLLGITDEAAVAEAKAHLGVVDAPQA